MKYYEITLWCEGDRSIGFNGCYSYERIHANNKRDARAWAKENCLAHHGYTYKIVSITEIKEKN